MNSDHTAIFAAEAPKYYERNLPVIPLAYHDKRPIPYGWSKYHSQMPTPEEQEQWLRHYPAANIGIVLGEQSGLCVVDIDKVSDAQMEIILKVLSKVHGDRLSPWQRVGAKGCVLAYRFSGVRTFRIKDIQQNTLVEMLSSRTQVVLPPSIHPTTQKPYTANCDLLEVYDSLPVMNLEIEEMLRNALKESGVELSLKGWTKTMEWVPQGTRDTKMTSMAGLYAHGVIRGELPLKEAISRLQVWIDEFVERVPGDPIDPKKGISNLISFLVRDVVEKKKMLPQGWDEGLTPEDKEQMGLVFKDEQVEWDFEQIKAYLHEQFEMHEVGTTNRTNAIDYALGKIAKSTKMSSLNRDQILRYIVDAGGMQLTMASLRARIKELAQGEIAGADHTEIAQAVLADVALYAVLKFCADRFWSWSGSHWKEKPQRDIETVIATEYGHYPAAKRFSDHRGIISVVRNLAASDLVTTSTKGVNFANGLLLENGELKPHDPMFGMTYTLPFRYMPESSGKAFRFQDFLARAWGRDKDFGEKVQALQETFCATIFGLGPEFQRAVLLHGAPKTGKSQLLTIVANLVPEEARSVCPPDTWSDKFAPATMYGKLLNICGELSEKRRIDGQKFKSIVCGEEISGQFKGRDLFVFKPICTHWFASNHLPRTGDSSSAFNRRWLILHFSHPLRDDEQRVINLGELIVTEEREAIAAWAVEAMPRLRKASEYTLPKSHLQLIGDVANMNNSVRHFILESGKVRRLPQNEWEASPPIPEKKLYDAFWLYAAGVGHNPRSISPPQFRTTMMDLASELGFRRRAVITANGSPDAQYVGLTIV